MYIPTEFPFSITPLLVGSATVKKSAVKTREFSCTQQQKPINCLSFEGASLWPERERERKWIVKWTPPPQKKTEEGRKEGVGGGLGNPISELHTIFFEHPPNQQRWYAKWKLSWTHIAYTFFARFVCRCLSTKFLHRS